MLVVIDFAYAVCSSKREQNHAALEVVYDECFGKNERSFSRCGFEHFLSTFRRHAVAGKAFRLARIIDVE